MIYFQDFQGDERFDIFLMSVDGRTSRNLTPNSPESIAPRVRWSLSGDMLAYSSNRSGKFHIYTIPVSGGEPQLLHEHAYVDFDPEWSPDGKMIAFASLVKGQDQGVFISSLDQKQFIRLSDQGREIEASEPVWSPDGRSLAFVSAEKGMYDIGIFSLEYESVTWLTDGKYECHNPIWSPKGDQLIYELNLNGNIILTRHTLSGGAETIQLAPGIHSDARFTSEGGKILFLYNGPKSPNDLWEYALEKREFVQLTKSLPPSLDTSSFGSPRSVAYKSSDGREIPSLLFTSEDARGRRPTVVYIHGGPTAQFTNSWNPLIQELLDRGYAILAPNYRGSTGYGREFREANRFVMGKLDLDDVVKGVDFLVGEGIADPARVVVTGGSFGGYLTMCALTKYPDLWAAGSALVPFLNWFTEIANERDDLQYWDRQNMGDPEKDEARLREASPIFFLDRVKAPVQLIAGAHDPRCPAAETIQARDELQKLGKQAEVILYEDEGHGFRKLNNRVDAYKKSVKFLSEYLERHPVETV